MYFAFQGYDLGNDTVVHSSEPSANSPGSEKVVTPSSERPLPHITFITQTSRGFMDINKETTVGLVASTNSEASPSKSKSKKAEGPTASENFVVVDWKKETVTFAGVTKTFKEAHKKPAGAGWISADLDWTWSGKQYKVKHKDGVVTAFAAGEQVAVLTLLNRHPFKKDELANVRFAEVLIPIEEMAFILFILLFVNLKLPADQPPLGWKGAGAAAGGVVVEQVAVGVVTSATCCCVVQ